MSDSLAAGEVPRKREQQPFFPSFDSKIDLNRRDYRKRPVRESRRVPAAVASFCRSRLVTFCAQLSFWALREQDSPTALETLRHEYQTVVRLKRVCMCDRGRKYGDQTFPYPNRVAGRTRKTPISAPLPVRRANTAQNSPHR